MSFEYFEAETHVSTYNKFRPSPPKALVEKIIQYTLEKLPEPLEFAIDVGCGSGQSTEVLAPYCNKILGLDSSPQIIKEARKRCHCLNVFYSTSPAEKLDVEDKSVSLLTTGQALHWFDITKFYSEVDRVLKPKGVFAVYGYNLPVPIYKNNENLARIIEKYYKDVLGDYTLPQSRKVYLENYKSKEFNEVYFVEGKKMERQEEDFVLEIDGTVKDVVGYVTSWSAYQNYEKQMGKEKGRQLLENFEKEFRSVLEPEFDPADKIKIKFNYFLLMGRKK